MTVAERQELAADRRLHVFVSYANEDKDLAKEINDELRRAFSPGIVKTTFAAEIPLGEKWRDHLEEALDAADVLLIVATGKQKLSHSFSGAEVGFFRGSRRHTPRMRNFDSDRIVIPIAIFTKIPEPVVEAQSIEIEGPLTPLWVETGLLKDEDKFLAETNITAENNPLLLLFTRIRSVINTCYHFNDNELRAFDLQFAAAADRLRRVVFRELQTRIFTEIFPERKVVIRLGASAPAKSKDDPLAGATIALYGRPFEDIGFETPGHGEMLFNDFTNSMPHYKQFAAAWTVAAKSLIEACKSNEFGENRYLLTSKDGRRFFRLFVGKSVLYYSGVNEIHIHVVEVKSRKYGDPTSSMLLNALEIALFYRFLFLESGSEFSSEAFELTMLDNVKTKVSCLIQELDYLLWLSNDAGLAQPGHLLKIYGDSPPKDFDEQVALWESEKAALYDSAYQVLGAADRAELATAKKTFIEILKKFSARTTAMNSEFTSRVLSSLQKIIASQKRRHNDGVLAS